jgi:hypothetical protein
LKFDFWIFVISLKFHKILMYIKLEQINDLLIRVYLPRSYQQMYNNFMLNMFE